MIKRLLPFLKTKGERVEDVINTYMNKKTPEVIILTEDQFWTLRAEDKIEAAFDANTELKDMGFEYLYKNPKNKKVSRIKVIVRGGDKKRLAISYYDPIPEKYQKRKKK